MIRQARLAIDQGHSMNPAGDSLDSFGAVFAEVFPGLPDGPAEPADDGEGCVADAGQRASPGADAATAFVHRDIASVMQFVLDGPVGSIEREQALG